MISFIEFLYLEESKIEYFAKNAKLPTDHVEKLSSIDPNSNKKHLGWLVKQHKDGNLPIDNENTHADHHSALKDFESTNGKLGDISKFKNVSELKSAYADHMSGKYGKKVFDKDGHQIWETTKPEHAENHGCKSKWCTAIHKGFHQAKYFARNNPPLYTHYPPNSPKPGSSAHKKGGEKYQFFAGEEGYTGNDYGRKPELGNQENTPINPEHHENDHPVLGHSEHWKDFKEAHNEWKQSYHDDDDYDYHDEDAHELAHSDDHNDRVRAVELGHHRTEEGNHLMSDPHPDVKEAILDYARNRARGGSEWDKTEYQRTMKTIHENSPGDIDPSHNDIHYHIANYTNNPNILHRYAHHWNDELIQRSVAQNEHANSDDLLHITKHTDDRVIRNALASNRNTPEEAIDHIMKHDDNSADTYLNILNRPNGMKHLEAMVNHPSTSAHRAAVEVTDDPEHLKKLANSPSIQTKAIVARKMPELLYNHSNSDVRTGAARGITGRVILGGTSAEDNMHMIKHIIGSESNQREKPASEELSHIDHPEIHRTLLDSVGKQEHNRDYNISHDNIKRNILRNTNDHGIVHNMLNDTVASIRQQARIHLYTKGFTNEQRERSHTSMVNGPHSDNHQQVARDSENPELLHKLATTTPNGHIDHSIANNPHVSNETLDHIQHVKYAHAPRNSSIHDVIDRARARKNNT